MSRPLFAAARGARIEFYSYQHREWRLGDSLIRMHHAPEDYRIHPDDEHLQYGPISSALRELAEKGKEPYTVSGYAAVRILQYECPYPFVLAAEWPHAQMLALIMAEALADEGL